MVLDRQIHLKEDHALCIQFKSFMHHLSQFRPGKWAMINSKYFYGNWVPTGFDNRQGSRRPYCEEELVRMLLGSLDCGRRGDCSFVRYPRFQGEIDFNRVIFSTRHLQMYRGLSVVSRQSHSYSPDARQINMWLHRLLLPTQESFLGYRYTVN